MRMHQLARLLSAAAVVTVAGLAVSQPAQAENPIVKLVSNQNGKCLQPASLEQGASVIQVTCNGSTAQQWTVSSGIHLQNRAASGECIDAFGPPANGTPIILWPCNFISNENWSFGITNNLLSSGESNTFSHCIATPGNNDNLAMELRFCDGNSSQLWSRPNG
jgi:alpha-galactosidase